MSEPLGDLFRPEAVEYHVRHQGPGEVLRVAPRWTAWLFWILLALLAAGLVAAWLIRVDGDRLLSILIGLD